MQSTDTYSLTAGVSKSNIWTRNKPEQISSTSMYWYSMFPHSRDARYAKTSCQLRHLNTSWTSSVSGECCSYISDSAQLPQTMVISVPVSPCTGKVRRVLIPKCPCWGKMWTASSVLSFTFFSSKPWQKSMPQSSVTVSCWSYPLTCLSVKMTCPCCYVSVLDVWACHNPQTKPPVTLKRESEYLETQYPKLFFSDCMLNILENILASTWENIWSLGEKWQVFHGLSSSFSSTCTKKVSFLPQIIRISK